MFCTFFTVLCIEIEVMKKNIAIFASGSVQMPRILSGISKKRFVQVSAGAF